MRLQNLFGCGGWSKPLFHGLAVLGLLSMCVLAACGSGTGSGVEPPGPSAPPAGRYGFARSGSQLLAIPVDAQASSPVTLAGITAEPDFALLVERMSDPDQGKGRYHDQLLFNGGRVYWLSGKGDGKTLLSMELSVPGFTIRACDHVGQPDDPAIGLVRSRQNGAVVEVDVHFNEMTGCIDAAGGMTLSVPLATGIPVVHATHELRAGVQADGAGLGTLQLAGSGLAFVHVLNGAPVKDQLQASTEDVGRVLGWREIARDSQGVFLCARTNTESRCALYYFEPAATPRLTKLSPDDFDPVLMGGMAGGRAYAVSNGPVNTGQLRMLSVHEFALATPFSVRTALSLTPEFRPISFDQSVLFYAQDTARYSQFHLADAASGAVRDTDLVTYGSGSSSIYADHRVGCIVSEIIPASREMSGCNSQAWVTPNYVNGVRDRTLYLVAPNGEVVASYAFTAIAAAAGFVGYETAADLLAGVKLEDGSTQLWRLPKGADDQRTLLAQGDVVLYGSTRPRGSVL